MVCKEGEPARGEPEGEEPEPPFRGTVMTKWWTLGSIAPAASLSPSPPTPCCSRSCSRPLSRGSLSGIDKDSEEVDDDEEENGDEDEDDEEVVVEMEMWSGVTSRFFFFSSHGCW